MLGLYAAVTRKTLSRKNLSGQPEGGWCPGERLTIGEAIEAYTLNTAYAGFEDSMKGSITVGRLADFVVLSADPPRIDPDRPQDVSVVTTLVGGRVVYEAN